MTGYHITKVLLDKCENKYKKKNNKSAPLASNYLYLKCTLKAGSEETAKWSDNRAEQTQCNRMPYKWIHIKRLADAKLQFKCN